MNEPLSSNIKNEMMDITSLDPDLLHNCIEEFDRVIFQVPQEFSINQEDQLTNIDNNISTSLDNEKSHDDQFDVENGNQG